MLKKITSDLDELVGDPQLRKNIRRLINGLGNLVSFTNELDREIQTAQMAKIKGNYYTKSRLTLSFSADNDLNFDR